MSRLIPMLAALAAVATLPGAAISQEQCGARVDMIAALSDTFHEAPVAVGLVNSSAVIEIFASADGTWTILATGTDGKSCVISAGEGFQPAMTTALMPGA